VSEATPIGKTEAEASPVVDNVVDLHRPTPAERRASALAFVKEHSGLAIVGSVAIGILLALLLPRRRKSSRRAAALAETVGAGAMSLGRRALRDVASAGDELRREGSRAARLSGDLGESVAKFVGTFVHTLLQRADDIGETAVDRAGKVTRIAAKHLGEAGEVAENAAVHAGERISRTVSDARSRIIG
jgi:hypothetical protein